MIQGVCCTGVLIVVFNSNTVEIDSLSSIIPTVLHVDCHDVGADNEALEGKFLHFDNFKSATHDIYVGKKTLLTTAVAG